jgi:hypothetical protein
MKGGEIVINIATLLPNVKEGKGLKTKKPVALNFKNVTGEFNRILNNGCLKQNVLELVYGRESGESNNPEIGSKIFDMRGLLAGSSGEVKKNMEGNKKTEFRIESWNSVSQSQRGKIKDDDIDTETADILTIPDFIDIADKNLCGLIESSIIEEAGIIFGKISESAGSQKESISYRVFDLKSLIKDNILKMIKPYGIDSSPASGTPEGNREFLSELSQDTQAEAEKLNYRFLPEAAIDKAIGKMEDSKLVVRPGDISVESTGSLDKKIVVSNGISSEIKKVTGEFTKSLRDEFSGNIGPAGRKIGSDLLNDTEGEELKLTGTGQKNLAEKAGLYMTEHRGRGKSGETDWSENVSSTGNIAVDRNYPNAGRSFFSTNKVSSYSRIEDVAYQITRRINIKEGEALKEIELKLEPESLGTINIRVTSMDNRVNVQIKTCSADTNEIINDSISILKSNLIEKGMDVRELSVSVDSNGSGGENDSTGDLYSYQHDFSSVNRSWYHHKDVLEERLMETAGIPENYQGLAAVSGHINIIV